MNWKLFSFGISYPKVLSKFGPKLLGVLKFDAVYKLILEYGYSCNDVTTVCYKRYMTHFLIVRHLVDSSLCV